LPETGTTSVRTQDAWAAIGSGTRFGFVIGQQRSSLASYVEQWQRAEAGGLDVGYVFDHFAHESGATPSAWFDAYATLAVLAARTERVRLGVLVTGALLRAPGHIAKAAITIDHASGGRFELGLGAGGAEVDHAYLGLPMPPLRQRVSALGESVSLVRRLFEDEVVSFSGEWFSAEAVSVDPRPVQARLPIWIGGDSDAVVRLAGSRGDGWNCYRSPAGAYRERVGVLEDAAGSAGRSTAEVRQSLVVKLVRATTRAAVTARATDLARRSGASPEEVEAALIAGGPADWAEELEVYRELGVRDFVLDLEADEPRDNAELLDLVASDLVPALEGEAR
jgi:alkanesulfonate monooxygenase SsuD/methylene tetrahydromethanopterin reductase-like flavin-dependent oxidoreductase (luciferase family)